MKSLGLIVLLVAGCGGSSNPGPAFDLSMQDPADAIVNGADSSSTATHWINSDPTSLSRFEVAFFADHTGRYYNPTQTGSESIAWQKLSPTNIVVTGADLIPSLTGISGSVAAGAFSANISGELHDFTIAGGKL